MERAVPGLVQEREGPAAESVLGGATAMASSCHRDCSAHENFRELFVLAPMIAFK